jgi:uncharacterized membrane protein
MDTTPGGAPPQAAPPPPGGHVLHPVAAIAAGWNAFLAYPWLSLGVLLVLFAIQLACNLIPFVNLVALVLVTPALYAGGAWFFLKGIRRESPAFENAFEGFQRWPSATGALLIVGAVGVLILLPMLVTAFGTIGLAALLQSHTDRLRSLEGLATLPILAVGCVSYPFVIWWNARAGMAMFTVMEADRPSALEAVKRSFALTRGSVWRLIGLFLLWIPVALVGFVAFCIGILPATLVTYYSFAHAYEQLRARAGGTAPAA